jgi:hypothetical protein
MDAKRSAAVPLSSPAPLALGSSLDRGGQHAAVIWFSNQGKAFFHRLQGVFTIPGYHTAAWLLVG